MTAVKVGKFGDSPNPERAGLKPTPDEIAVYGDETYSEEMVRLSSVLLSEASQQEIAEIMLRLDDETVKHLIAGLDERFQGAIPW